MAREHIFFDNTEVVIMYSEGKNWKTANLPAGKIVSITIEPAESKGLFGKKNDERIVIRSGMFMEPVIYLKSKEKQFFDSYKAGWEKFCRDNRVTYYDNTNK